MSLQITDNIYSVGIDDPSVRVFEAQYPTPHGMSYNSYVIVDRMIAVMDSVESGGGDRWVADILDATGGRHPDYLVVHHMEPDHSANILTALGAFPALKIVTSAPAAKMLPQFFPDFDFSGRVITVKEGDTLALGDHTLRFFSAPMVHWPEVIVSYEESTRTLFSADAFGKFGAISHDDDWVSEARRYYVNIVGRYGSQVASLLKKLGGIDVVRIAPLHGPVLDGDLQRYFGLYGLWSSYTPETDGVLIAYASIYGGTAEAALELADMLRQRGVSNVEAMDLTTCMMSEAVAQAFRYSALVLASPTYDAGLFPVMGEFIRHLAKKNFRNRAVGYVENGSWAPIAARKMSEFMSELPGISVMEPVVTVRSRLSSESRSRLQLLAESIEKTIQTK